MCATVHPGYAYFHSVHRKKRKRKKLEKCLNDVSTSHFIFSEVPITGTFKVRIQLKAIRCDV